MTDADCIFCKIIRGEMPATIIFEDELCMAFMDIFPVSEGHCLLIPKSHYTNMLDADPKVLEHLITKLSHLDRKVASIFEGSGILNTVANGKHAGQEVPHLHFHVIPRKAGADFGFRFPKGYRDTMASREELERIAGAIRDANVN